MRKGDGISHNYGGGDSVAGRPPGDGIGRDAPRAHDHEGWRANVAVGATLKAPLKLARKRF